MSWPPEYDHVFRLFSVVKPKRGYWLVACPAHDDRHPSGTVRLGMHGLLLKCHGGTRCTFSQILSALATRAGRPLCCKPYNGDDGRRSPKRKMKPMPIAAIYPYADEQGEVLFEKCRVEPGPNGEKKTFMARRRNPDYDSRTDPPDREFLWNLDGVRRVLYRLPDLCAHRFSQERLPRRDRKAVFLMEGEKDVETAYALGLTATTGDGGACNLHITDVSVLAGNRVIIPFDRDRPDPRTFHVPGLQHALQAVNLLTAIDCQVHLLRLPGGPGDFTNWTETMGGPGNAKGIAAELKRLIRLSPPWGPWGPEGVAENGPRLCRWMAEEYDDRRGDSLRLNTPAEVLGELAVRWEALRFGLAAALVKRTKMDNKALARELARVGAVLLAAADDLNLFKGDDDANARQSDGPASAGNNRRVAAPAV